MSLSLIVPIVVIGFAVTIWLVSFVVEALRRVPEPPTVLRWAPEIPIFYVDVGGCRLRYIRAGRGPNLVLLHTLGTQLDLFEKTVRDLANDFTVFALDYPGHGYSDIPKAAYDASFFADAVAGFLDALDLREVTLSGVSIGGTIPLILAARHNPRVARVIAINSYDYARGRGIARGSAAGWVTAWTANIPVVAETFHRLRSFAIVKAIYLGGVADPANFPPPLLEDMYCAGNRRGHYRALIQLLRHAASWEAATELYTDIQSPVRLVWGERDWSRPGERDHDHALIQDAYAVTIENAGHLLPLDRPGSMVAEIRASAASEST
jgi:pimeloyl-ACP methyl ester carboxylesterase